LGCHGEGRLNIHCQRIETGDVVKRCSLLYPLADADVLFQNAACNGCGQTQAATTAMLGKGEFQAAFGRLGRRLGRIRTAGLETRFGDQALPEELLVPLQALARERGLGVRLDAVTLELQGLGAGHADHHLALDHVQSGGGFKTFDDACEGRRDHPLLPVGYADRRRQAGGSRPAAGFGGPRGNTQGRALRRAHGDEVRGQRGGREHARREQGGEKGCDAEAGRHDERGERCVAPS